MRAVAPIVCALAFAGCVTTKAEWDPAAYRAAVASGDAQEMGRQARAAERRQALVGLTRERVHALLGTRPSRRGTTESFPAGDNGSVVDRDAFSLLLRYDRSGRVVSVDYTG
ncbi:hypothetical protein C8N24_6118 [Solirubrobacter pauli]|uniref:Uncharacterized protein n=1 Tax=Solirubrobacter pauli TaxID=166793 RepID=A0A660L5B8_9ACTN|nr:hypothetical protein [Solirubrobacter pauli]RKQ88079.1 hypothetical protein C8N24_6118 [Solirubrobacter pauli]